jgi:hypothetical protein
MGWKRRYRFIDRKQQVRFAVSAGLFSFLIPLLFLGLTAFPTLSDLFLRDDAVHVHPLFTQLVDFCFRHWSLVLLYLLFISLASILFSHLIFGPMRRFEMVLAQKKENPGERVVCNLRKGDYFHSFSKRLEEALNERQVAENPGQSMAKQDL